LKSSTMMMARAAAVAVALAGWCAGGEVDHVLVNFTRLEDVATRQRSGAFKYRSGVGSPKTVVYDGCREAACVRDWTCGRDGPLWNSRKYAPACQPAPRLAFPLLVTGAPGAGTSSVTAYLNKGGARATHEEYGLDATVSWQHAVNDFVIDARYPNNQRVRAGVQPPLWPRFRRVAHVVRCPLTNILALKSRGGRASRHFVAAASTIVDPDTCAGAVARAAPTSANKNPELTPQQHVDTLAWAARMYVAWNAHVEAYADDRFAIEAFGRAELERMCATANLSCPLIGRADRAGVFAQHLNQPNDALRDLFAEARRAPDARWQGPTYDLHAPGA